MKFLVFILLIVPAIAIGPRPSCEKVGSENNRIIRVATGAHHTCVTLYPGKTKCWGNNNKGQLGLGDVRSRGRMPGEMEDLPFIDFEESYPKSLLLSAKSSNTCVTLANDSDLSNIRTMPICWGSNEYGQLGLGDKNNRGDDPGETSSLQRINFDMKDSVKEIPLLQVAAGGNHSCTTLWFYIACGTDGKCPRKRRKCWGNNEFGQLGQENKKTAVGDEPNEMGDNLPIVLNDIPDSWRFQAAYGFNLLVYDSDSGTGTDHRVLMWGRNNYGQLGVGHTRNIGRLNGDMDLLETDFGGGFIYDVCVGDGHACMVFGRTDAAQVKTYHVKCWGRNDYGQLGLGDTEHRGDNMNEMGTNLPEVDLGNVPAEDFSIVCGGEHTCIYSFEGSQIKCWGRNKNGQLGYGDKKDRGGRTSDMGDNLPFVNIGDGRSVLQLSLGQSHTCAILDNYQLKCWGRNTDGELGLGDTKDRDEPTSPNIGCYDFDCHNPGCPEHSTCSNVDVGIISCQCDDNYINNYSPVQDTTVDPYGQCTPRFQVTYFAQEVPDILKISVSKLVSGNPMMHIGFEVYKWISEDDKELVGGFEDQKNELSQLDVSSVELEFGGLESGSKYHFVLFPLTSPDLVREGVYSETIDVETLCDCSKSCYVPGCPEDSTCSTLSSGRKFCQCNTNYVNNYSPVQSIVEPNGKCSTKFQVTHTRITAEVVRISLSKLANDNPPMHIGFEVHKWKSEDDKEQVAGFEDQKKQLYNFEDSSVELDFGLDPQSKYQIVFFPISSSNLVREGQYEETVDLDMACDCYANIGGSQPQQIPEAVSFQDGGFVMFRFPDVSRCEDQYKVSRIDETKVDVSTVSVEVGVCATELVEPGIQLVDDLHRSKLVVGETYTYEIYPGSSSSLSHQFESTTVQHTVQWEASVLGNVAVPSTPKPVSGLEVLYQLRSYRNEVVPLCIEGIEVDENTPWDIWCRTTTSSDGNFTVSFKLNHRSLTNDNEASFRARFGDSCNNSTSDCEIDEITTIPLKHLSFNVAVELYLENPGMGLAMPIAIGTGAVGGVLLVAAIVAIRLRKKLTSGESRMEVFDDKNTYSNEKLPEL